MQIRKALVATAGAGLVSLGGLAALPSVAGASPAPSVTAAPAPVASPATDGVWPAQVDGMPSSFHRGGALGYYLWHTSTGWHLQTTHPGWRDVVFSGTVTADGALAYKRVDLEHDDFTRIGPKDHVLSFAFNNHGGLDGVSFVTARTTQLTFRLAVDGHAVGTASVRIGAKDLHPDKVPFVVERTGIN